MNTVIHSVRLVDDGVVTDDAWVALSRGTVTARGTGDGWRAHPGGARIDLSKEVYRDG